MIGIVFINNLDVCPYLKKYLQAIENHGVQYEIIYWNRDGRDNEVPKNHHVFQSTSDEGKHPIFKIVDFFKFRRYALRILKEKNYDKLIVLTSLAGVMFVNYLRRSYHEKYIFDYRDASYEWLKPFYKSLSTLIKNSYFTSISSEGFKTILPDSSYILAHNIKYKDLDKRVVNSLPHHNPIKVYFIGLLSDKDYLKKLIELFSNDSRFELAFHGDGECYNYIKNYANDRIAVTGRYTEETKNDLFLGADMIFCNRLSSYINDWAMANKLYEAVIFKKPLIGNSETYSGEVIKEYNLGISLSFEDDNYLNNIYDYYEHLNRQLYDKSADDFLNKVLEEDKLYIEKINEFICED